MRSTRRQFVGTASALSALALSGIPAWATAPSGAVRQSLAAFSADPAKVASLRKGVAVMKALPASDHRSWFFWAATHAYSDALLAAEVPRDPKLADVNKEKYWNQCPHFGQCSADFAIWHRAYLHFFERALRDAAGDPTLALPYWDYAQADQRVFPAIFAPQYLDRAKTLPNPLFHPNREISFTRGLLELSAAIGQAPKTSGAGTFFHQIGAPGFGGDALDSNHTQIGLLEQRPHNDIHLAVGGVIDSANGAMAEITTAAFDPVFWVHHANIDRLWSEWASKPGKEWGPAPSADWFDERPWTFVDADGSDVTLSRREAIALVAPYDAAYDDQMPAPPSSAPMAPVTTVAPPASGGSGGPVPVAAAPRRALPRRDRELVADNRPFMVTPRKSAHRRFGEDGHSRGVVGGVATAPLSLDAPEFADGTSRVLLELSEIRFTLVPSSGFAVYLDGAGERPGTDPVGLIDIFGATHQGAGMRGMVMPGTLGAAQRFDVTAVLRRGHGPFTLRVEPYDLLVARDGKSTPARADAITIGAVRFVVTA